MNNVLKINFGKRKRLTSVLGLALDGSRLEGVVLRRTNGALQLHQTFSVTLSLDPLTAAPELVGREIRNHLDAAGVRERHCVLGVPLKWVLTAHTELPPLPEADAASLLQLEAERGFPCDVATLLLANSRCPLAAGKQHVTLAGIPNAQLAALEQVLAAAKLKPASFALGLAALQPPAGENSNGVLALAIGESQVSLQITCGGGVAALRGLEGAIEDEAGRRRLDADLVAREARITLGQLPSSCATPSSASAFSARVNSRNSSRMKWNCGLSRWDWTSKSPRLIRRTNLASSCRRKPPFQRPSAWRRVCWQDKQPVFEFLPPKPTLIEQFAAKYSSGRLRTIGAMAAGIVAMVGGLFLFQEFELILLRSRWSAMSAKVGELQTVQNQIQQYHPWYDDTFRDLAILRQLTLAFPEDGAVTAKTIEIQNDNTVSCSGNARDSAALLATLAKLRAADGVRQFEGGYDPRQITDAIHV